MQRTLFKLKGLLYLCFTLFLLAACDDTKPTLNNSANLTATSSKNYTASLTWDALSASKVTLERKAEDGEFAAIAEVTGQTSFEDFPVFDDLNYTYRLTDGTNPVGEASLNIAAVTASPLTVTLTPEASPVTQTIGTAGGSISATGANGVVYTLSIPADALLSNREITLTPISQIGNLPLSGGLLSAVKIEPEGLEFYGYARLTMTLQQAGPANTSVIGFSSSNAGQEFYLSPVEKTATPALQAQQNDEELVPLLPVSRGGTYGTGAGTSDDVKKQIQDHPPTDSASQTQQQNASGDDELTPLVPASELADTWERRLKNKEINRPSSQTQSIFREYRQWLEYLRQKGLEADFDAEIKAHSKRIAERVRSRSDELSAKCEVGDSSGKSEIQTLINWSEKYPALVQNLGAGWFTATEEKVKKCSAARFRIQGEFNVADNNLNRGRWRPSGFDEITVTDSFTAEFTLSTVGLVGTGENFQFENLQNTKAQYAVTPDDDSCSPATLNGEPEINLESNSTYGDAYGMTPFQFSLFVTFTYPGSTVYRKSLNDCKVDEGFSEEAFTQLRVTFIEVDLSQLTIGESRTITEIDSSDYDSLTITVTRLDIE